MTRIDEPNVDGTASELVLVAEPGTLSQLLQCSAGAEASGDIALGGLLSDALFGEVIDISDLIPRVLSSSADAVTSGVSAVNVVEPMQSGLNDGDVLAAPGEATVLTILYDDDMLALGGTIL